MNYRLNQFYKSIIDSIDAWKFWYDSNNPQDLPIPEPFKNIDGLEKLIIIKCIRSDKVVPAVQVYIYQYVTCYNYI
jgi:dynein heavy chain